jgi:hypothetical protein
MTKKAKYKEEDRLLSTSPLLPQTSSSGNIISLLQGKASGPD